MPSPRWPSRSITRRSTTRGPEQELAVAVAARDRRRDDAGDAPAQPRDEARDVLAYGRVHLRVAHDPFLDAASGFELRLDQRDHPRGRPQQGDRRRAPQLERNKTTA